MADSLQNEDILVRYLDGELPDNERAAVEQRLQTDAAFLEQYEQLQVAVQAIRQLGTLQQVEGIHREMMNELRPQPTTGKIVSMRKYIRFTLAIAASLLVLFIGVRIFITAQASPDRIYNETFVDFNVANTRSAGSTLSTIETLYQQKAYDKITTSPRSLQLAAKDSLLIGLSYLQQEDFSSAINWLHALAATDNEYRPDAEFYLSLSYLKAKQYDKAIAYMQNIHSNPGHLYHEQVSEKAIAQLQKLAGKN